MSTSWRIALLQDNNENDSDKTFSVPNGSEWEILWLYVQYTSSSNVGGRQLEIQIQDSGSTIAQWQAGIVQNESTNYNYLFGIGMPDMIELRDTNYLTIPLIALLYLKEGQSIRIWDNNAIDTSGDDMLVQIEYGYHNI